MSAVNAAQQATGVADDAARSEDERKARVQRWTALLIAVIAVLLATNGVGGSNAAEDALHANILASDTWNFFPRPARALAIVFAPIAVGSMVNGLLLLVPLA